ncbi:hypothetical protein [Parasphingorhabdus sp.]|uniref:hypothetical protein n=1 Tax=Parasphingorhabdus sp. TaxID=2709688 RepID=UPI0030018E78
MKIDVDALITVRKNRGELFREEYFSNRFWDVILTLYSHDINERPINTDGLAENLKLSQAAVVRHLTVLAADGFVCGYEGGSDADLDLATDNLALTSKGFENAGTVIRQMRRVFT